MTKDEALGLALKALETPRPFDDYPPLWRAYKKTINEAITAIKEALAQPEQEPVAWVCYGSSASEMHDVDFEQIDVDALPVGTMLYPTPPQRTWVSLTYEEADKLWGSMYADWELTRFTEAKLKDKNTREQE